MSFFTLPPPLKSSKTIPQNQKTITNFEIFKNHVKIYKMSRKHRNRNLSEKISLETPLKIEKLAPTGQGIGTLKSGKKIFLWNTLPGEKVLSYLKIKEKSRQLIEGARATSEFVFRELDNIRKKQESKKEEEYGDRFRLRNGREVYNSLYSCCN